MDTVTFYVAIVTNSMIPQRTYVGVTDGPIDTAEAVKWVTDIHCGAVASFVGITRADAVEGRSVVALEFETHAPLAEAVLQTIVDQQRADDQSLVHVFIQHRVGRVPVGEANVVIGVSSGHRKSVFTALEAMMTRLKRTLPMWKKEVFDDGHSRWMQNVEFNTG